jgi:hypothetical protein
VLSPTSATLRAHGAYCNDMSASEIFKLHSMLSGGLIDREEFDTLKGELMKTLTASTVDDTSEEVADSPVIGTPAPCNESNHRLAAPLWQETHRGKS